MVDVLWLEQRSVPIFGSKGHCFLIQGKGVSRDIPHHQHIDPDTKYRSHKFTHLQIHIHIHTCMNVYIYIYIYMILNIVET